MPLTPAAARISANCSATVVMASLSLLCGADQRDLSGAHCRGERGDGGARRLQRRPVLVGGLHRRAPGIIELAAPLTDRLLRLPSLRIDRPLRRAASGLTGTRTVLDVLVGEQQLFTTQAQLVTAED